MTMILAVPVHSYICLYITIGGNNKLLNWQAAHNPHTLQVTNDNNNNKKCKQQKAYKNLVSENLGQLCIVDAAVFFFFISGDTFCLGKILTQSSKISTNKLLNKSQ